MARSEATSSELHMLFYITRDPPPTHRHAHRPAQAWGVYQGKEKQASQAFAPGVMLAAIKDIEIIFEASPETIIQTILILSIDRSGFTYPR